MTFSSFRGRTRTTQAPGGDVAPPASTGQGVRPAAGPAAYVDATTEFAGKLRAKGMVQIEGRLTGEIYSDQVVIISEGARLAASIEAESVMVSGEVKGNIAARRKITLGRTARVTGDLCTPGIVIEEGAKLKGRIVIGSEEETASEAKAETKVEGQAPAPAVPAKEAPAAEAAAPPETAAPAAAPSDGRRDKARPQRHANAPRPPAAPAS